MEQGRRRQYTVRVRDLCRASVITRRHHWIVVGIVRGSEEVAGDNFILPDSLRDPLLHLIAFLEWRKVWTHD
jgi:hypothetical protein